MIRLTLDLFDIVQYDITDVYQSDAEIGSKIVGACRPENFNPLPCLSKLFSLKKKKENHTYFTCIYINISRIQIIKYPFLA